MDTGLKDSFLLSGQEEEDVSAPLESRLERKQTDLLGNVEALVAKKQQRVQRFEESRKKNPVLKFFNRVKRMTGFGKKPKLSEIMHEQTDGSNNKPSLQPEAAAKSDATEQAKNKCVVDARERDKELERLRQRYTEQILQKRIFEGVLPKEGATAREKKSSEDEDEDDENVDDLPKQEPLILDEPDRAEQKNRSPRASPHIRSTRTTTTRQSAHARLTRSGANGGANASVNTDGSVVIGGSTCQRRGSFSRTASWPALPSNPSSNEAPPSEKPSRASIQSHNRQQQASEVWNRRAQQIRQRTASERRLRDLTACQQQQQQPQSHHHGLSWCKKATSFRKLRGSPANSNNTNSKSRRDDEARATAGQHV